jgi:LPS export ABC transporter protein LptC
MFIGRRLARRGLLLVSGLLVLFLAYAIWSRADPAQAPGTAKPGILQGADAGIDRFTFLQSKDGSVQWQVEADRARVMEAQHRAELEKVRVTLFGAKGWELKVEGDSGTINTATKDFVLTKRDGPLVLELQGGYRIYTNHLVWTDRQHEVTTEDPVRMTGDGVELTGRGLIARLDTEEFKVLDDVHLEIVR